MFLSLLSLFLITIVDYLWLLPTFPPVSRCSFSDQQRLRFCLPACNWKDSSGSGLTWIISVRPAGGKSRHSREHLTARLRQCERGEIQRGALITFLPPCSPFILNFTGFLWTLKGVSAPRLDLMSDPYVQRTLLVVQNPKWENNVYM